MLVIGRFIACFDSFLSEKNVQLIGDVFTKISLTIKLIWIWSVNVASLCVIMLSLIPIDDRNLRRVELDNTHERFP